MFHHKFKKIKNLQKSPNVSTTKRELKFLENVYRAVNIGLVNELKVLTDKLNLNI